jgi:ATP-binding cassette subfamily G (WHITE) protein 2
MNVAAGEFLATSFACALDLTIHRFFSQGLNYHVSSSKDKKDRAYLLKDMTGYFEPGSGKTTLLDVMAGRKTAGVTEGELLFWGSKPSCER